MSFYAQVLLEEHQGLVASDLDSAVSDAFQLNLEDWSSVGYELLIPFDRVTITGKLGEG